MMEQLSSAICNALSSLGLDSKTSLLLLLESDSVMSLDDSEDGAQALRLQLANPF